jgi:dTDP-D-glucose 4,6-dehydratase
MVQTVFITGVKGFISSNFILYFSKNNLKSYLLKCAGDISNL